MLLVNLSSFGNNNMYTWRMSSCGPNKIKCHMKIKSIIHFGLLTLIAFFISGEITAQTSIPSARAGVTYGKKINADEAITIKALNDKMRADTTARFTGKVKGKIVEVCKSKGCYVRLDPE